MCSAACGSAALTAARSSLATAAVGAVRAEVGAAVEVAVTVEVAAAVEATAARGAAESGATESAGATAVAGVIGAVEVTAGVDVIAAVGVSALDAFAADGSCADDASAIDVNRRGCALASRAGEFAGPLGVEAMGDTVVTSAAPRGVAVAGPCAGVRLSGSLGTAGTMAIMDGGSCLRAIRPPGTTCGEATLCTAFAGDTGFT